MERYHLDSNKIEFQPKLYSRVKSEQQLEKEEDYGEEDLEPEDYIDMVEEDNLTPRDVRLLVRAEEELDQCRNYRRIFPDGESSKFLKYLSPPSYSDRLLDSWERRYGDQREAGRDILRNKCLANMHLDK